MTDKPTLTDEELVVVIQEGWTRLEIARMYSVSKNRVTRVAKACGLHDILMHSAKCAIEENGRRQKAAAEEDG